MRFASQAQSLDSFRFYTRGHPLAPRNVLSKLKPDQKSRTFCAFETTHGRSFAQVSKEQSSLNAQLNFLVLAKDTPAVQDRLIEACVKTAGQWGAHNLLCDLPQGSPLFPELKRLGFRLWCRQKIYRCECSNEASSKIWRHWTRSDIGGISSIYRAIVPSLLRPLEPMTRKAQLGYVCEHSEAKLCAYLDFDYALQGVWLQAFALPDLMDSDALEAIFAVIRSEVNLPLYLSVRSYQPWLESLVTGPRAQLVGEFELLNRPIASAVKLPEIELAEQIGFDQERLPLVPVKLDPRNS